MLNCDKLPVHLRRTERQNEIKHETKRKQTKQSKKVRWGRDLGVVVFTTADSTTCHVALNIYCAVACID